MPKMRRGVNPSDPPEWYYEPGEEPEQIDWEGQRSQIDAAVKLGYKHIVLVSSMGVTRPEHPLNQMGKILMWKYFSEQYLRNSGIAYTIIHAGGLIDQAGGERELLVGHNDEFLDSTTRAVPRADLAEVVAQALLCPEALDKDFDLVSKAPGQGTTTTDFAALFAKA